MAWTVQNLNSALVLIMIHNLIPKLAQILIFPPENPTKIPGSYVCLVDQCLDSEYRHYLTQVCRSRCVEPLGHVLRPGTCSSFHIVV